MSILLKQTSVMKFPAVPKLIRDTVRDGNDGL